MKKQKTIYALEEKCIYMLCSITIILVAIFLIFNTNTNYLILGNNDYCSSIKDGKSSKHKKAEKYKLEGQDIEIIDEDTFYNLFNLN